MSDKGDDDQLARIRNNDPSFHCYCAMIREYIHYALKADSSELTVLAEALQGNTHLQKLILHITEPYRYLSHADHAETLATAVANSKLSFLHLKWVACFIYIIRELNPQGIKRIESYFIDAARQSTTIQHLAIDSLQESCIGALAACLPHLQSLYLNNLNLANSKDDVGLLCEGLQRTSTLTTLHLTKTKMGSADDFRQLSQALANNASITSLHIEYSNMGDDGIKAFVEHWHHDSQIRTLAFVNAGIKAEGAVLLVQAASSHPATESLSIKRNKRIGYNGLANIAMELPNVVLKSLNVAGCATTCVRQTEPKLNEVVVEVGGLIAQSVSANTHLLEIDISDNGFDDPGGQSVNKAVAFYTLRNKYSRLMVSDLHVPASLWCDCFAKNGKDASFIFHFLREQPMLWHVCRKNK